MDDYQLPGGKVLVLRTCDATLQSYGGFEWPESGPVECHDWNAEPVCGGGLHGLLWGAGESQLLSRAASAKWMVVEVDAGDVVDLGGKVKYPRGSVIYCGERHGAVLLISRLCPPGTRVFCGTETAGDLGTATAGDLGTATAGDRGTATAGWQGTATAGHQGTATAGDLGTATAGDLGTATAGHQGTATAGYRGTATAGWQGTATAGDRGTATAGDLGTATAGYEGTATAGDEGVVAISYRHSDSQLYRLAVGYVGEDGIKPHTAYHVVDGKLVEKPE